ANVLAVRGTSMPEQSSQGNFRRTKVSSAIRASLSLLALGAATYHGPLLAQQEEPAARTNTDFADDDSRPIEEIVTRGVRRSLESAQALKRNSSVIVDSVTAEDIGALPDRSVTETLQRIPGVAINRFAAGRDPDHFSVEGDRKSTRLNSSHVKISYA